MHNHAFVKHCIGAATGDNPLGPFEPQDEPLVCPPEGSIDSSAFFHHGQRYLVYKAGGLNSSNRTTQIQVRNLDATGTKVSKNATSLITNTTSEYDVEGPGMSVSPDGSTFFLFFATGLFNNSDYAIRYASSASPLGPFDNSQAKTLFDTGTFNDVFLLGPGAPSFINSTYVSFMSTQPDPSCDIGPLYRYMHVAEIKFDGDTIVVPTIAGGEAEAGSVGRQATMDLTLWTLLGGVSFVHLIGLLL